ncbi:hypothetical protein EKK58_11395 [Candidatus Dependentiae bacterium]|nr:MAG: hypothetical protein EKK58_11395 [Candidatus Dependentiae bacterium]
MACTTAVGCIPKHNNCRFNKKRKYNPNDNIYKKVLNMDWYYNLNDDNRIALTQVFEVGFNFNFDYLFQSIYYVEELKISNIEIDDLSILEFCVNLKNLDIIGCDIVSLSGVEKLYNLDTLHIIKPVGTAILKSSELLKLKNCFKLTYLVFCANNDLVEEIEKYCTHIKTNILISGKEINTSLSYRNCGFYLGPK